jgi:hypothetical protein
MRETRQSGSVRGDREIRISTATSCNRCEAARGPKEIHLHLDAPDRLMPSENRKNLS